MHYFLSIIAILGFVAASSAQTVQPTNATSPPPVSGVELELRLRSANSYRGSVDFVIRPLTLEAGLDASASALRTWSIPGRLTYTDASNANAIVTQEIAYINCEQSSMAQFTPSQVVATAARQLPRAIVLYAKQSPSCTLEGSFGYNSIYTLTNSTNAYIIERNLNTNMPGGTLIDALIAAESVGTGNTNSGPGGPAPPTTVAMSILYTVTGLITLLFLIIICTGALRARRNPERYGPRRALNGRPSRSRAKGLAIAMLETIPIVKFGDPEPAKPGSSIELEDGSNTNTKVNATATDKTTTAAVTTAKPEDKSTTPVVVGSTAGTDVASGMGKAESFKSAQEDAGGDGDIGCSICTEDFTAGEDVRLLPCRHKFHPACVDPWLLNVSGTCPLCRHDLNPTEPSTTEGAVTGEASTGDNLPPSLTAEAQAETDAAVVGRRRRTRFLDFNRLRQAPPAERIAALRALREASSNNDVTTTTPEIETPSRRRLRDRLHLGSRPAEPPASASTPPAQGTTDTPR